ncbi:MAG: hypothetical protein GY796_33190, partial [Chloroflexi bacterium]|nr:hypothetical protein [Chloroflexota bacterium]
NFEFYWNLLAGQFYTTVPGLIGIVYLFRIGHRKYLALTGASFLTYLPFNLLYNVTDIEVFFIPVFLIWAIWSGIGAAFLLHTAATLKPKTDGSNAIKKYKRWRVVLTSLALAIFAFMIIQLYQRGSTVLSRRYTWQVHDYGLDMLAQPPTDQEAAIVGILGEMTLLRYFQQTENRRPDIKTVTADLESDRLAAVENLLAGGNIVYLTRELPGAAERWSLNAVGPLIRVDPEPTTTLPEPSVILNQPVTSEITLAGYTISRAPHTGQGLAPVRLILFWQANAP